MAICSDGTLCNKILAQNHIILSGSFPNKGSNSRLYPVGLFLLAESILSIEKTTKVMRANKFFHNSPNILHTSNLVDLVPLPKLSARTFMATNCFDTHL